MQDQNPASNPFAQPVPPSDQPMAQPQPTSPAQPTSQPNPGLPTPQTGTPAPEPEDLTPANFQLGAMLPAQLKVKIPAHELQFDENKFLNLLAASISLSREEKKRIIETIPKLKQAQVDELMRIFEEEKYKFSQLSKKHLPQLEKLAKQHYQDWIDLETQFHADAKKENDQAAADEIRKSLGL